MTGTDTLRVRFSAFAPDGDRLGQLSQPTSWNLARLNNDIPTLSFSYSTYAARSDLLDEDCEVVAEWSDGTLWREDYDSRFILLSSERDEVDPTASVTYNCVGYSWMLSKATVVLSDIDINPANQKRQFVGVSVGSILKTLLDQAHSRGNIPNLTYDFTADVDSNGDAWLNDGISIAFDRGTDYMTVLSTMAQQGMLDWRMNGRTLQAFNADNTLAIPRANRARIRTTTTIDPQTYLAECASETVSYGSGGQWVGDDGARITSDVYALACDGEPNYDSVLNYEVISGVWEHQTDRQVDCYRQLGTAGDGVSRAFGSFIAETTGNVRYALVVADAASDGLRELAYRILNVMPNGIILQNGTSDGSWFSDTHSGFHAACTSLIDHGLPTIVLDHYDETLKDGAGQTVQVVAQNGQARDRADQINAFINRLPHHGARGVYDKNDSAGLGLSEDRPDDLKAKRYLQSINAQNKGALWMRVLVTDNWLDDSDDIEAIAESLQEGIETYLPRGFTKAAVKQSSDPDTPRTDVGPVTIRYREDCLEGPVTRSIEDYAAIVFGYGDSFAKVTVVNDDANLPWGKWETVIGQGGLDDPTTMQALALQALDEGALAKVEVVRKVALQSVRWLPYRDYDPGDYILVQTATNDMRPYRIQQITISRSENEFSASLIMQDAFESRDERISRAVRSAPSTVGGSSRVGGAGVKPGTDPADNRVPSAPASVAVTTERAVGADGLDRPVLHISWDPVTTATDGSTQPIDAYFATIALSGSSATQTVKVAGDSTSTDVEIQATEPSLTATVLVNTVGSNGRSGAQASSDPVDLDADTTPPAVPTTPTVSSIPGALLVAWDGSLTDDIPADFDRVDVHMSDTSGFDADASNVIGYVVPNHRILTVSGQTYGATRYFKLTAVDKRGNRSDASSQASGSTPQVGSADIGNNAVTYDSLDSTVTDPITEAASDASSALAAAASASSAASAALTAANGKNQNFYGTSDPDDGATPGGTDGDRYYKQDATTHATLGVWRWNGTTWGDPLPIDGAVLTNLDAGTITTGTLTGILVQGSTLQTAGSYPLTRITTTGTTAGRIRFFAATDIDDTHPSGEIYFSSSLAGMQVASYDYGASTHGAVSASGSGAGLNAYLSSGASSKVVVLTSGVGVTIDAANGTTGAVRYSGTDRLTWDNGGVYVSGGTLYLSSGTTMSISGSSGTTQVDGSANVNMTIAGDRRLAANSAGMYLFGTVTLRPVGGSLTTTTIVADGTNVTFSAPGSFVFSKPVTINGSSVTLSSAAGNQFVVQAVYDQTTTGSANTIVGSAGSIRRTTSLSKYKLDQQPIGANYAILDLPTKTWVDKHLSEEIDGYDTRTAGIVAEDVVSLSETNSGAFDPLALKSELTGELEGVANDRIVAYLIPVIKDMVNRITALETS